MRTLFPLLCVFLLGSGLEVLGVQDARQKRQSEEDLYVNVLSGETITSIRNSVASDYNVYMLLQISNHLKYQLRDPKAFRWYGFVSDYPTVVSPCRVEAMAAHKRGHSATGTSGIVSWVVEELGKTIIALWSIPYSFGCNQLSIGIYPHVDGQPDSQSKDWWIDYMYDGPNDGAQNVTWMNYCSSVREICQTSGDLQVCGTMGTSATVSISMSVKPTSRSNLASDDQCQANLG